MASSALAERFCIRWVPGKISMREAQKYLVGHLRACGHDPDNFNFRFIRAYDVEKQQVIESLDAYEKEQTSGKTDRSQP